MTQPDSLPEEFEPPRHDPQEGYRLRPEIITEIKSVLAEEEDAERLHALLEPLHAGDVAELLDALTAEEREKLLASQGERLDPEILTHLSRGLYGEVTDLLGAETLATAISQLETGDAIQVMEELDKPVQEDILQVIPRQLRAELETGLAYPDESAGRMMDTRIVTVPSFWSIGDTIDFLRSPAEKPTAFYALFVVDPKFRPVGQVMASQVLTHARATPISEIMEDDIRTIPVEMDQEDVAYTFRKYGLVSAPVTNEDGRMIGMIQLDQVIGVVGEEDVEDFLRLGGVKDGAVSTPVRETAKTRFQWLFVNLLTALLASMVIGLFDQTIERFVALAVLMPIVASMGGNAGTQTLTVAVRAIAQRELTRHNAWRTIQKEIGVGLINGLAFALICAAGIWIAYGDGVLAFTFALSTVLTLAIAGGAGALIPITLDRLRIDPAISSSIFLTTVTDVVAFFAFLGLAALLIG